MARRAVGPPLTAHRSQVSRSAGCGLVQLTTDAVRADAHRFNERLRFVAMHVGVKLAIG